MQNTIHATISYDIIVIGAGAAGLIAAITAARHGKKVLLLEKLSSIGSKLKATGGGRCNLTNTLSNEDFITRFGRNGRFMAPSLEAFDHRSLMSFFAEIGVESHSPDGYRVFPISHSSLTVISALENEIKRLGISLVCSVRVSGLVSNNGRVGGVITGENEYRATNVIIATGGLGYPNLGAEGDGFGLAMSALHTVVKTYPAMLPLRTKEVWVAACCADTIARARLCINLPKMKNLCAVGDLIFTKTGIRGPVVLDFAREVIPLLEKYSEVPLLANLTKGLNEEQIRSHIKEEIQKNPQHSTLTNLSTLLPESVAYELCVMANVDPKMSFGKLCGANRDKLTGLLAWTPLTVIGHDGFKAAMITRGGVSLKEICPKTMESKLLGGLFFCGEVMDLDGPCGGYNLQWSFSSGYVAGHLGAI
jgi:predicted Rossmann fold flavoprotein